MAAGAGCAIALVLVAGASAPEAEPPLQRPARVTAPEADDAPEEEAADPGEEAPEAEPGDAAPTPTDDAIVDADEPVCPCEDIDWKCRQENRRACRYGERRAPAPTIEGEVYDPPEAAPVDRPPRADEDEDTGGFEGGTRRGVLLTAAGGIVGCVKDWCSGLRAGGWGQTELGVRFGIVAPILGVGGGGGPRDEAELAAALGVPVTTAKLSFLDVGAGLQVYPVRNGRFDLFFAARLGFQSAKLVASGPEGLNVSETIRRGSVRFGLGLPIFVTDTFAIGPRFDLSVPFAGNACARVVYMGARDTECTAVKALEEELNVDSSELPLPFTFLIELRAMLGVF